MSADIPGPRPWPLIGNLLNIDLENSVQSVVDIGKQYGMPTDKFHMFSEAVRQYTYLTLYLKPRFANFVLGARTKSS